MNLSFGDRPVRFVYPTMAPLAASIASSRRMECSTSIAGGRLKYVRPSLSNSATSLTCIMVAIGGSPNRSQKQGSKQKRSILAQNRGACQGSQRVSLEESLFFVYAQNH